LWPRTESRLDDSARFWTAAALCRFASPALRWKSGRGLPQSKTLTRNSFTKRSWWPRIFLNRRDRFAKWFPPLLLQITSELARLINFFRRGQAVVAKRGRYKSVFHGRKDALLREIHAPCVKFSRTRPRRVEKPRIFSRLIWYFEKRAGQFELASALLQKLQNWCDSGRARSRMRPLSPETNNNNKLLNL